MEKQPPQERRREERFIAEPDAWVAWTEPSGHRLHLRGRCLDVSSLGIRIETDRAIPVGAQVTIGVPVRKLQRTARVRHEHPSGPHHVIGFEYD
jgi:hypothetical protein